MPDQPLDLGGVQVRVDAWVTPPPPTDEHAISVYGPVGNVAQYTHEQWDNLTAAPADRAALLSVLTVTRRALVEPNPRAVVCLDCLAEVTEPCRLSDRHPISDQLKHHMIRVRGAEVAAAKQTSVNLRAALALATDAP